MDNYTTCSQPDFGRFFDFIYRLGFFVTYDVGPGFLAENVDCNIRKEAENV